MSCAGLDAPTDYGLAGYDAEKAAARTAVQAAAGALINVTGQTCDDIVLCAGPREETAEEVRLSVHDSQMRSTMPRGKSLVASR